MATKSTTSVLDAVSGEDARKARRQRQPSWAEPMRAVLTDERFSAEGWIFEPKLDGERCLAFVDGGKVRLMSRNQKSINSSYPEIVEALEDQPSSDMILDGEVVAFRKGAPSFSRLQRRMHVVDPDKARRTGVPVYLYVFDILHVDGYDVTDLPLRARKQLLRKGVAFRPPLRWVTHRNSEGIAYYEEICAKPGWEGVIAKRADGPYRHTRSRDWLKFKCANEQELVIGGYTDPQGSRSGFGALLVGYYDGDALRYAGKVGTGFDRATLELLLSEMSKRPRAESPFVGPNQPRAAHWVEPELVAQIGFAEWTGDGRLRHPRFLGLRRDKDPRSVIRERG